LTAIRPEGRPTAAGPHPTPAPDRPSGRHPIVRLEVEVRFRDRFRWQPVATFRGADSFTAAMEAVSDLPGDAWWRVWSPTVGIYLAQGVGELGPGAWTGPYRSARRRTPSRRGWSA
jgi:hypothetical protein